jgi:predicted phosphodiesterase
MILYFPDLSFNLKEFISSLTMLVGNCDFRFVFQISSSKAQIFKQDKLKFIMTGILCVIFRLKYKHSDFKIHQTKLILELNLKI